MKFKYSFYDFQEDILDKFEEDVEKWDKKIHIVAPPGSGKTIVGIEMINRIFQKKTKEKDLEIKVHNPYNKKEENFLLRKKENPTLAYKWNCLILVPNITLQYQWRDKIEKFYLEKWENIDDIVSIDTDYIKKINILTYQALTQSTREDDFLLKKLLEEGYKDIGKEFDTYEDFLSYVDLLKQNDPEWYKKYVSKYRKKIKFENVEKSLSSNVRSYLARLKWTGINNIVLDEAHHLTNWRSKVVFYMQNELENPFIVWLTATPPFEDVDFFVLDDDYTKLLWEVDYYVPTPAIVKSGRLAPYNDLVYFVPADKNIQDILLKRDEILNIFLKRNQEKICSFLYKYIKEDYDKLLKNSNLVLINYLKFLSNYSDYDISNYIYSESITSNLTLKDIAKSVWKYLAQESIKIEKNDVYIAWVKKMFYDLWYVWRWSNFYRFRTPIESLLIYSKSKLKWVKNILNNELKNQWDDLKCAIITDFLEDREGYINCKSILKQIWAIFPEQKPILVSGQGIWKLDMTGKLEEMDINIIQVTQMLETWETNILIWTRWILGEGWDCPKLNTLIDLTGVSAYMSVNQVRWRAIRLDLDNEKKVANIYDIVCVGTGYKGLIDYERLEKKHEKFYGVDDSGLVIKWVNHIYPDLESHLDNVEKINENMIRRAGLKDYVYELWGVWGSYENKEIFGLDLEVLDIGKIYPYVKLSYEEFFRFTDVIVDNAKLNELTTWNFYYTVLERFLNDFVGTFIKVLIALEDLPKDFSYEIRKSKIGNFKVVSLYSDQLVAKHFLYSLKDVFSTITTQRYIMNFYSGVSESNVFTTGLQLFGMPVIFSKNEKYRKMARDKFSSLSKKIFINNSFENYSPMYQPKPYFKNCKNFVLAYLDNKRINNETGFFSRMLLGVSNRFSSWGITNKAEVKILKKKYMIYTEYTDIKKAFRYFGVNNGADKATLRKNHLNFLYLNARWVNKKDYIGKKTFLKEKIEKMWI